MHMAIQLCFGDQKDGPMGSPIFGMSKPTGHEAAGERMQCWSLFGQMPACWILW